MLELVNLTKVYDGGEKIIALNGISLKIDDGEFVAIVGPSGCGKSTLLHTLGLLDTPDKGEYFIDGSRVDKLSSRERAKLRNHQFGFVFQSFNLLARTSAFNNVLLPLNYRSGNSRDHQDLVTSALKQVNLLERKTSWPNQLSGGQQQRIAIARALVTDPKVILADEPTGNLDTKTGLEIMKLFEAINKRGKTVIVVTHNEELLKFANRVIKMTDGQVIEDKKR
jgi:putative ABC transport system ATP-binding protein